MERSHNQGSAPVAELSASPPTRPELRLLTSVARAGPGGASCTELGPFRNLARDGRTRSVAHVRRGHRPRAARPDAAQADDAHDAHTALIRADCHAAIEKAHTSSATAPTCW